MSDAPLDVPALEKLLSMLADREDQAAHRHREARHLTEPWDQLRLAYFTNNAVEREQQAIALRALGARLSELVRDGAPCSCDDWIPGSAKINGPILLAQARNPHLTNSDAFQFIAWRFCPWCGHPVRSPQSDDYQTLTARSPALAAPEKTP